MDNALKFENSFTEITRFIKNLITHVSDAMKMSENDVTCKFIRFTVINICVYISLKVINLAA